MTVWCHLPTIFKRRHALRTAGLIALCVAIITTLFFASPTRAEAGINQTLSFQGRLLNSTGGVVPDGYYNIQFKIYQDGAGTAAGNSGGTLKWTESRIDNGGNNGVEVKNGYFAVDLGSVNPFGSSIDWNQDTLWLSMNVAGYDTGCTAFGNAPCTADGEMLPMKRLTSVPFAIYAQNANTLNGLSSNDLVHFGLGLQNDITNNSSIAINKTGSGSLIQLQSSGIDAFTVNNAGNITLGSATNQAISVAAATSGAGKSLTISGGASASGSVFAGGDVVLQGGAGDGSADSGKVIVKANSTNSSGTFQVQNTSSQSVFSVDTVSGIVSTGTLQVASATTGSGASSSLWSNSDTPATVDSGDSSSLEVGLKFQTALAGNVTGVKFYKSSSNTGTHIGNLWDRNGNNLASVTFSGETASGWQSATFSSPVYINANTTYVISYFAPNGGFSRNSGYFTSSARTVGSLTALKTGTDGTNSVYSYGGSSAFPSSPSSNDNYWVDVLFQSSTSIDQITSSRDLTVNSGGTTTIQGKDGVTIGDSSGSTSTTIKGNTTVKTPTDSTSAFNVTTSLDNKVLTVDTANARVAIGALGTSTPSLDGYGLQIQGALKLDGGSAAGMTDIFTTPVGSSVHTKINIPLYNPGEYGQLIALGLPNTADPTSRVLSLFDARTSVHQPTIGVFSPDENNLIGFSWDGSNSIASVKNTGNTIALQGGGTNLIVAKNNSSVANVGIGNNATSGYALDVTGDTNTSGQYRINGSTTLTDAALTFTGASNSTISSASGHSLNLNGTNGLTIQTDGTARATFSDSQVQIGDGSGAGAPVLLTVDKAATAPTVTDENATLGSMYYDTTLGKLQCYEADGWGQCSSSPDTYVTISPEYTNAVTNGIGTGTMTSDLCSDALNINDGSSSQPTICGTNETYNYYNWTASSGTDQTRSIYVTYQLPDNFKNFITGSTSLMGRTDSANSTIAYQLYRNDPTNGLTACGSSISVSTGSQSTWQKAAATSGNDPSGCSFAAGDSIVFKISLTAKSNANAYTSNLSFTYSSN